MGQYYRVVNVTKREYINPHDFDCGAKLMEFAGSERMGEALTLLLAIGNGAGGGDFDDGRANWGPGSPDGFIGRWAGDRIAVVGDYADWPDFAGEKPESDATLYGVAGEEYRNISQLVRRGMSRQR